MGRPSPTSIPFSPTRTSAASARQALLQDLPPPSKSNAPNFHALSESQRYVPIRIQRFVFLSSLLAVINSMLAPPLPTLNSSHAPASIWSSLRPLQQAESPVFLHATRCAHTRRWVLRSPRQPPALPLRRLGLPAARHKRTLARARATTPDTARRARAARAHAMQTL
jgi:hypothetical protein